MPNVSRFDVDRYAARVKAEGFAIVSRVVGGATVDRLRGATAAFGESDGLRKRGRVYGARNLLGEVEEVRCLARAPEIRALVDPILGAGAFAVRATFFDKVPEANWKLGWHQDSVIAVRERLETDGFGPWSQKGEVWQVQPPAEVLAEMLAVRVHLDDCDASVGPLRVLPGSHRHGWLDDEIDRWKSEVKEVVCEVPVGGCLVMWPLLLHASSAADSPSHRRVVHLEFAERDLPGKLDWRDRVGS